jgi:hypothetical protein
MTELVKRAKAYKNAYELTMKLNKIAQEDVTNDENFNALNDASFETGERYRELCYFILFQWDGLGDENAN